MVLTDSMEVNGFVNTRREKMKRNIGQEYTKYGKNEEEVPRQPPLTDETTAIEPVRADGFSKHCADERENLSVK